MKCIEFLKLSFGCGHPVFRRQRVKEAVTLQMLMGDSSTVEKQ